MSSATMMRLVSVVAGLLLGPMLVIYLAPTAPTVVSRLHPRVNGAAVAGATTEPALPGAMGGGSAAPHECPPPPECNCEDKVAAARQEAAAQCAAAECPSCEQPSAAGSVPQQPPAAAAGAGGTPQSALTSWQSSPYVATTNYTPGLTPYQLQKGVVSYGATARARRAMAKLLAGQPISIGFLGGSVTWGQGAAQVRKTDYAQRVFTWIRQTFPHANHTLINGGIPAAPSSYFALCHRWHAPDDADLLVVEFNINDEGGPNAPLRRSHERLLRKLLAYKNRPAVVEMVFFRYPQPDFSPDVTTNGAIYRYHSDDESGVLAQYYHLPWLGTRSLVWDYLQETAIDPATRDNSMQKMWTNVKKDGNHPSDIGHGWLADMLIYWMQQLLDDVARNPLTLADEEEAQRALSVPMYQNNWETGHNTCLMGDAMKELVTSHDPAFQWINEGSEKKPKWGFVSNEPGSVLRLTVNTNVVKSLGQDQMVTVALAYLKSYEHMGQFEVACEGGCACDAMRRDGHHAQLQVSQMHFTPLQVTPADACQLKFTVLNKTTSGEHKFKLIGVVVSDAPGMVLDSSKNDMAIAILYGQRADGKGAQYGTESDGDEERTWR